MKNFLAVVYSTKAIQIIEGETVMNEKNEKEDIKHRNRIQQNMDYWPHLKSMGGELYGDANG